MAREAFAQNSYGPLILRKELAELLEPKKAGEKVSLLFLDIRAYKVYLLLQTGISRLAHSAPGLSLCGAGNPGYACAAAGSASGSSST